MGVVIDFKPRKSSDDELYSEEYIEQQYKLYYQEEKYEKGGVNMDHVIDAIMVHLEPEYQKLLNEWQSKEYKKMSDCPSWGSCKAMINAIHILERYYYNESKTISLSSMLRCDISHIN